MNNGIEATMDNSDDIFVMMDNNDDIATTIGSGAIQYGDLQVGQTITGAPGTNASVSNSGTSSHVILNFTIPQGEQGIQGIKGNKGEKGDKGDAFTYQDFTIEQLADLKGEKGDKGDKGDAFTYQDFTIEQLADLKGEKGDKGDKGEKGDKGDKGSTGETGRGITSVQKTITSGLVDTYTITYTDGTTSTFNVTNGAGANADLENLKYYEYSAFSSLKLMYLYSGDYDYNTLVNGHSFGARLSELIYGLSTIKSQAGINESINDDNDSLSVNLKGIFSTLLNALTEDSYCMCNYYSTSVYLSPTSNQAIVMFGDGTAIQYEVSNNVETITYLKSDVYRAGINISIANDGTINNTYTLPSDVVQDSDYVHTDNNFSNTYKSDIDSNISARHTHTNKSILDGISSTDITNWNNKSNFSGSYNDLTNKPTIPNKTSDLNNDSGFINKNANDLTNYYKTSETYNKTEIDNKISSVYRYKGTVATYANLPSISLTIGDVYNVESTGDNYAWTGTVWDKLGGDIDLSGYQSKIDSSHKLNADLVDDTSTTNKFTSTSEKNSWNAKYDKPSGGIPSTDMSSSVQTSLGKADTAIQDVSDKEDKSNKVTTLSSNSTDTQYPSAKCVYDLIGNIESLLSEV